MPRKHWAFDVFMARIQQGETAAEAKAFILANFPQLEDGYLTRVLDNMGDIHKADTDYADQQLRSRLDAMRGSDRQVIELSDEAIRGGQSFTATAPDLNAIIRGRQAS